MVAIDEISARIGSGETAGIAHQVEELLADMARPGDRAPPGLQALVADVHKALSGLDKDHKTFREALKVGKAGSYRSPDFRKSIEHLLPQMLAWTRLYLRSHQLRQAVAIADIPEATLRNWLTRKQLPLAANDDRTTGEWRLFSERDILILALAGRLNKLGVPITNIKAISAPIIPDLEEITAGVTAPDARRSTYIISRCGDDWRVDKRLQSDDAPIPSVAIVVDPVALVRETLGRLYSSGLKTAWPTVQGAVRKRKRAAG